MPPPTTVETRKHLAVFSTYLTAFHCQLKHRQFHWY